MASEITTTTSPARHFIGVRRVVKRDGIGPVCAEILPRTARWLAAQGLAPASAPATVYHSVNRETGDFDIQPGFFVSAPLAADDDLTPFETAGGDVLTVTHVGPYDTIGDTWHALFAHAASIDRTVTKSSWEIYVEDPGEVEPAKLRTEIFVPLDPA